MKTLFVVIMVVSILGNIVGLWVVYKAVKLREEVKTVKRYHEDIVAKYELLKSDFSGTSEYREANLRWQRVTPPEERKATTVLFGASITRAWDLDRYFPDKKLLNRGIAAQSDMQLLARFSSDILQLDPGRVVLKFCSGNFRPELDNDRVWDEYETMIVMARNRNIEPLLATIIPATRQAEEYEGYIISRQIEEVNDRIRDAAKRYGCKLVDYHKAMADENGFLPEGMARDPIHPNEEGYTIMAETLLPFLK